MTGVELIAHERQRQIDEEGWTPQHDLREHRRYTLARAALCYLANYFGRVAFFRREHDKDITFYDPWPFDRKWDKRSKHSPNRSLVIAGALIAAELDRLQAEDKLK
jgi:hypothetical protein